MSVGMSVCESEVCVSVSVGLSVSMFVCLCVAMGSCAVRL